MNSPSVLRETLRLLRPFWPLALFATVAGTVSGLATAWLLATINTAVQTDGGATRALLLTFGGLCALTIGSAVLSNLGNSAVGQRVISFLQHELCTKIVRAPISEIERFRAHRLMVTLNRDIDSIAAFAFGFSALAIAFAVSAGCLVYLLILSPTLFLVTVAAIVAAIGAHWLARRAAIRRLEGVRDAHERLLGHFRALCDGAKELRVNRERRVRVFRDQAGRAIEGIRAMNLNAVKLFTSANAVGSLLFFVVIGIVLLLNAGTSAERAVVSGFVIVLLYVKGPMEQLVLALPMLGQAQVAMRRIAELTAQFASAEPHLPLERRDTPPMPMETIELAGASYTYPGADGAPGFTLGPVDLAIRRGEMLFVTGENGSGKTTLIKLILALYEPGAGRILVDGVPLALERRDDYRQLFSTVFFDFFLFQDLVVPDDEIPPEAAAYLEKLEIAHKVAIRDGAFSTIDLSAGQRKRLALIQVYLEKRPILVFDEWAAEQDPTFRRIFYTEILPDLKRQGKTLIVISHDDRYFDVADRRLLIANGKVVAIVPGGGASASADPRRAAASPPR